MVASKLWVQSRDFASINKTESDQGRLLVSASGLQTHAGKSFCTDSSSLRLTTLQLVKNHMAVHYNKILSAKAAVDCSVPVSMNTSIKYADQQRREKLKKELAQYEKEFKLNKSVMQGNSKMNSKSLFRSLQKYRYYTPARRKKNFPDQQIDAETQTELSSFHSNFWAAETKNLTDSDMNTEQRSNCMTNGTEIRVSPLPLEGLNLPQDKIKDRALQQSSQRILYEFSTQLSSDNKIYSDEEDLLYLNFIQDVTDEILKLGLFSNRFLERLFERHIKQNKHHLEEEKMRRLLHGLKVDLGCTSEENPAKQNNDRMSNLPDFQKALNSNQSELNSILQLECQQYQEALDMSSMPKDDKMFSLPGEFLRSSHKHKCSEDVTVNQVNDETDLEVSTWDENNPGISNSLMDQETSVDIVECDSDTKKLEASRELCCLSTSPSLQYPSIKGGINHGKELSTLRIMEMSTEG
ncbi:spermatogenesis-associated protein 7 isoform X11 [Nannospalax galili]|uniref:spermatogenesis-associated protein 7 isoform X11 n=1 Tax=Nannospalax galili TaxID=1026970 RepID=UPI00111C1F72|nr:spermatogenesis-associated protein 7 isoform X11 [Nannospalax galili]